MIRYYRDLIVWQKAMTLVEIVYDAIRKFPACERYCLTDQLARAVVSVPSNIAEGNGRETTSEYARFLGIARGSLYEVETQLEIAHRLGYIEDLKPYEEICEEIRRILIKLIMKFRSP